MNVLIVTGIFPPDHGGPASYVPLMATELTRRGHEVSVITLSDDTRIEDRYPFPVTRLPRNQARAMRVLSTISRIWAAARNADCIYLNGLVFEGVVGCSLARRPFAIKVVGDLIWERATRGQLTRSNVEQFQSERLPLRWRLLRSLQSWYTGRASHVIIPSRYLDRIVALWGVPASRRKVIYNAVNEPAVTSGSAQPLFDVVTVGRLVQWKGMAELIAVCAAMNLSLRIVGDGPMREALEDQARSLGAKTSFAGHVHHDTVAAEIVRAEMFVLNSSYEGLPHIVLEAKMLGIPVIATDAGGTGETIEHGTDGWLVPVGDNAALAQALNTLHGDSALRKRLAANAGMQVRRSFSYETMVQQTESVLLDVAASGSR